MEKLLDGVEVEWKSIKEIIFGNFWIMPTTPKFNEDGEIPYITSKNIRGGNINFDKVKFISYSDYLELSRNRPILVGDILISMIGTIGEVARVKKTDLDFYGQNMYLIRLDTKLVNSDFFLHFFDSPKMKSHFNLVKNNSGQGYLKAKDIENLPIPIPPLEVQEEIVRILETLTEVTAELKAELKARKQQYEYYRDKLLTFEEDEVEWRELGDIGQFTRGKRFVKTDMLSEGFPCIHYGEMYTHYNIWAEKTKSFVSHDLASKLRVADHGDVVIVAAGETIEDIGKGTAWLGNTEVVIHDACFSYRSSLNPKYVSYFLRTKQFHDQIKKHISSGKISAINANGLAKAKIPIPSLEKQERIVFVLDKFDTLTSSIIEGLPREIELRKKQYEFYRNMLLSFPKEKVEV
ncbi:restriction endonuclease subunit S [Paenibacillus nuruki]|uniref:restriction endonuclease subunit S n=1 Tax=Paenibacillus nuruki TaxID=1886670 RepID=UPI0028053E7C|nr:restriction endonuclease subunit S [Paenibacillus nuruki]